MKRWLANPQEEPQQWAFLSGMSDALWAFLHEVARERRKEVYVVLDTNLRRHVSANLKKLINKERKT